MQAVTTIGLDIAKSVFQIHAVDAAGEVMVRRQLKRRIVFAVGEDPVRLSLVASLARPGGNLTGVNYFSYELIAKRLDVSWCPQPRALPCSSIRPMPKLPSLR
jgi:hypothetical protein